MTVEIKPLHNGRVEERHLRTRWKGATVGLAALLLGVLGWLSGGKYSVEGWVVWLNLFLDWLKLPLQLPTPAGWWVLIILPVAYFYSDIEVRHRPFVMDWSTWTPRMSIDLLFWVVWLVIVGTDVGSTFRGVRGPSPGAWPLVQQVTGSDWLSAAWAIVLTFAPEWLIIGGVKLLRR
jgi:hypothetical protein